MSGLVSVIISDLFEQRLRETIDNLNATADGPIEIVVKTDDDSKGMRYCLNQAANEANGEYLFKIDGHCIMSPGWDTKMKESCGEKDIVHSRIRSINGKSWTMGDKRIDFCRINKDLTIIECGEFTQDDPDEAETMTQIGCGWMIRKQRFNEMGQNWLMLGRVGNLGVEWSLKTWLSGGRMLVRRDVTCGHLFRPQFGLVSGQQFASARRILGHIFALQMGPQQKYKLGWLLEKFPELCVETREPCVENKT